MIDRASQETCAMTATSTPDPTPAAPGVHQLPAVDRQTTEAFFERGKQMFTAGLGDQAPACHWDDLDDHVRWMWACAAAEEMGYTTGVTA